MVRISLGRMVAIKKFELNESLEWHLATYKEWNSYLTKKDVTAKDLVEVLKGNGKCSTTGSDDSPEFKALREQLGKLGYIQIQRRWWNGDRVLKPFMLNGVKFKKDTQFSSGAAMKIHLEFARKYSDK